MRVETVVTASVIHFSHPAEDGDEAPVERSHSRRWT